MVARETLIIEGLGALGFAQHRARSAGPRLDRLADLLIEEAIPRGFLGPDEAERIVSRHILDSAAVVPLLSGAERVVDVGSGAGLPGAVLAVLGDAQVTILDAQKKRADFVRRIAEELDLRLDVVWERAENAGRSALREAYDAAVSRALATPPVALELLLPLVCVGGRAVVAGGPTMADDETVASCARAAELLGGATPKLVPLEVPGLDAARWGMIVAKTDACPEKYPRRTGVPARRPIA